MKKRKDSPLPIVVILSVIMLIALCWCFAARAQTPGLVVSASASGLTPSLVITSNSSMPWKGFTVLNQSNGTVGVLWAESDGASGGIYYGNVALSVTAAGSSVAPRPAPATDLPLSTLSQATVAAIAGIPADEVTKMAAGYEALATQVDAGTIVSPLQLQLATGTHLLASFDAKSLESFKGFTAAVAGWIDAQQCGQADAGAHGEIRPRLSRHRLRPASWDCAAAESWHLQAQPSGGRSFTVPMAIAPTRKRHGDDSSHVERATDPVPFTRFPFHPMNVRAKFKLSRIVRTAGNPEAAELFLEPVCADGSIPENQLFHRYTPSGELRMYVNNPSAAECFELGKSYYLDFTPASQ